MKICQYCETENSDNAKSCSGCGAKAFDYLCPNCHHRSPSLICEQCGMDFNKKKSDSQSTQYYYSDSRKDDVQKHDAQENNISKKSKTVSLLLAIFAGYVGAHQFYAGKIGMGVLYVFTYGLFGIGWIMDIIHICKNQFKDNKGKYISK